MKKIILMAVVLAASLAGNSQNEQQKEAEVRAMELTEVQALLQKDIAVLRKIWSPGFMVNAPLNAVFIGGQVELVIAGIISYTSFIRTVEQVLVLKDVVITMGSETVVPSGVDPMAGQTIMRRYSNIWMKEKGNWTLVARHANDICQNLVDATVSVPQTITGTGPAISLRNNPSTNYFELTFSQWPDEKINIRILDYAGSLIQQLQVPGKSQSIRIGEKFGKGVYFAEITNGKDKRAVKLVKL